jgi:hypothetical protein
MSIIKDTIKNILSDKAAEAKDGIESVLYSKVDDALKTKKMEISAKWLNDVEAAEEQ